MNKQKIQKINKKIKTNNYFIYVKKVNPPPGVHITNEGKLILLDFWNDRWSFFIFIFIIFSI